ncbi:hypothetical protein [Nocardia stercoris]|uniref:Mce-associated membrane protein n=1 Tax=Nocardia stercoris TaxID=2483361 RepID=A0A3M2LBG3_9NOCA|nr:hypothetical protein [Nocardia stercoris]RMI34060.1 hypothetical protein EBN03_06375 [Nocardia stercoris]
MSEDDAQKTEKIDVASGEDAAADGVAAVTVLSEPAEEQPAPEQAEEKPAEPTVKFEKQKEVPASASSDAQPTNWLVVGGAFAAGVVLVGAATLATVFGIQSHSRGNELAYRDSATQAACDFGNLVSTWDPAKFDDYITKVKAQSTGAWLDQFASGADPLKELVQQANVKSSVSEIHCGWQAGDADHATVVMLISQQEQKPADPQPQISDVDVVATLEHKGDNWVVSDFKSPRLANMLKSSPAGGLPGAAPAPAPAPAPPK